MSHEKENATILRMEDVLGVSQSSGTTTGSDTSSKATASPNKGDTKHHTKPPIQTSVKGRPKSGRFWKSEKKKFSTIIKTKGLKNSLEKKQALREKLQKIKELSRERVAKKREDEQLRKERRRENLRRQEENRKKSEVVQVITNTKKLKKMKKKQLRHIEKRDTTIVSK